MQNYYSEKLQPLNSILFKTQSFATLRALSAISALFYIKTPKTTYKLFAQHQRYVACASRPYKYTLYGV